MHKYCNQKQQVEKINFNGTILMTSLSFYATLSSAPLLKAHLLWALLVTTSITHSPHMNVLMLILRRASEIEPHLCIHVGLMKITPEIYVY